MFTEFVRMISQGERFLSSSNYSTKYHLKIWFCKPYSDSPVGGMQNELRLIRERVQFKHHDIRVIYHRESLSAVGFEKLQRLGDEYQLQLMSLDEVELRLHQMSNVQDQLELLLLAKQEIMHPFGNLAAASDIVRTLAPALEVKSGYPGSRIYCDIDEPLSISLPSMISLAPNEVVRANHNNNLLITGDIENPTLQVIRQSILKNYQAEICQEIFIEIMGYVFGLCCMQKRDRGLFRYLQSMVNQNDDKMQYPSGNVFQLRAHIAHQLSILQQNEDHDVNEKFDIQRFWNLCYLKLVCKISGPGVYNMAIYEEKIVMMDLFYRKQGRSDLSWVPNSAYLSRLQHQVELMKESALIIQRWWKKHTVENISLML